MSAAGSGQASGRHLAFEIRVKRSGHQCQPNESIILSLSVRAGTRAVTAMDRICIPFEDRASAMRTEFHRVEM
eukprot:scaffold117144_cov33-Prasinocladus_malaysianus.AAC.2